MERNKIEVELYDLNFVGLLIDVISTLNELGETAIKDGYDELNIGVDYEDNGVTEYKLFGWRFETDDELITRQNIHSHKMQIKENEERELYERLRQKFEPTN